MQLHRVELLADGNPVAQAHVLLSRYMETPEVLPAFPYPHPDDVAEREWLMGAAMAGAIRTRPIEGSVREPGRAIGWLAMEGEIIAGTAPSPFVKACLFADFGNGIGSATKPDEWSYANLDISVNFLRMPLGQWLLIDADTVMAGNGHGLARSIFADAKGIYAYVTQTVFVGPGKRR